MHGVIDLSTRELAHTSAISPASVSRAVAELTRQHMVSLRPHSQHTQRHVYQLAAPLSPDERTRRLSHTVSTVSQTVSPETVCVKKPFQCGEKTVSTVSGQVHSTSLFSVQSTENDDADDARAREKIARIETVLAGAGIRNLPGFAFRSALARAWAHRDDAVEQIGAVITWMAREVAAHPGRWKRPEGQVVLILRNLATTGAVFVPETSDSVFAASRRAAAKATPVQQRGRSYRHKQVEYTDASRAAAEERARRALAGLEEE